MKVDGTLGSLLQGVSLQPPRDRFNGQCTLQENMTSDAVKGLSRRPPTDLVGYLGSASTILGWHYFQTRNGNKFIAMFKYTDVKVFDLNAVSQPVTVTPAGATYLGGTTDIRCATDDADKTVVVNPSVSVFMTNSKPTYFNTSGRGAAIFQVLGGAYGKEYCIYIGGVLYAKYRPPNGATATDNLYITTSNIAARLVAGLVGVPGTTNPDGASSLLVTTGALNAVGWEVTRFDDVIYIRNPSGSFTASVSDGAAGINFKACTDTVTDIADLPRIAPHYYAVRVAQNADSRKDLWFKFIATYLESYEYPDASSFGTTGYWKEAVAPDVDTGFDQTRMPHKLTYNGATFTFDIDSYASRAVGTEVSNPTPSFVNNKISDVSTFQGRTVFLSGSSVIMSRTNRTTNFWQGSATALVDTDPIDINSTVESSQMLAAVQYNKDLAVFSPKAQFVVFGRTAITPMNATLVLTTKFESELQAHPTAAGRNVFFASNFGQYTGVREFYSDNTSGNNDSRPITQHVNKYLVGKATRLTASANYETLLVHTDHVQTDVYAYQYIWNDAQKVQSSWSTWKFENNIVHSFFDEDLVYLVQRIGTDYYLLRMPLEVQDNIDIGYPVYLDQRFDVLDCYSAFVLPYAYLADRELVCVQGSLCPTPGLTVAINSIVNVPGTGYVVTLKKNMLGGNLVVGTRFNSSYMPTMPSMKDANGATIGTAKMRPRAFIVALSDTGEIAGRVRSKYGDGPEVSFNSRIVGDVDNVIGVQPLSDERFVLPFRENVNNAEIEFYSDSHLPMTLTDIEYVGQYSKRGQRVANNNGGKQ